MARIDTGGTMSGRPCFSGRTTNTISGTAHYGNTTASWNTSGNYFNHVSGNDPAIETVRYDSWTRNEGWSNYKVGTSQSRYMTGEFISGCEFQWRTYPNSNGGSALRRWGIGIVLPGGVIKRWSSAEIDQWSTSSSWRTISYNFSGDILSQLNNGARFAELHIMMRTPSDRNTPGQSCPLEIRNFKYKYKSNDLIVPAMRGYTNRDQYPIAS